MIITGKLSNIGSTKVEVSKTHMPANWLGKIEFFKKEIK